MAVLVTVIVLVIAQLSGAFGSLFNSHVYALGDASKLIPDIEWSLAKKLQYSPKQDAYVFNSGATPAPGSASMNASHVSALIHKDASKGVSVSDPTNNVDFSMTPRLKLMPGEQDGNRIVYPLADRSGWLVYTIGGVGVKEDLLLNYAKSDTMSIEYDLNLGDSLQARLNKDGSVGVYGNKLFASNITTAGDADAKLLEKARKNAPKDTHLFSIPKPVVNEKTGASSNVVASYELQGETLKVNVRNLKAGNYPLSIDPSIYVVTAAQFMYGNNETNINFDIDNKMIRKGRLTGARFDSWQNTANLPIGSWGSGSVAADGYIYQVGGASFSGQVISTQGTTNYVVPNNVTSINVSMWGGGGGGGQSSGGPGGGGGYVTGDIAVTPGETLVMYVGGGGGTTGNSGGGGGGFSSVTRQTGNIRLLIAGGGGGGGQNGGSNSQGGGGGNNGSNNGVDGSTGAAGGKGGTQSAGGAAGTSTCAGQAGSSLNGGDGAQRNALLGCQTGGGGGGGAANGGIGGAQGSTAILFGTTTYGGGGGGSGYFGGGGGGTGTSNGGGGGGGSSYINTGFVTSGSSSPGAGSAPGNNTDPYRGNAGNGGANATAGSTGLIVISTNAAGNPATKTLNWAKFDPGNGTVINADPGSGACAGWCTTTTYDMPAERSNFSLVAYNGYLYAMGGNDEFGPKPTTTGHKFNTIYVAKLGANGEPRLWNPTNSDPTTWTYWHTNSITLPGSNTAGYINASAVAYNNKMYWMGGLDDSTATGVAKSNVYVANILPTGQLGSWSASTSLSTGGPGARYGMTGLVYNDRIYVTGGSSSVGGAPAATVYYIKINSDGSLASSWVQASSFNTGRLNMGGTNAVVWGGYLYITGGCSVVNANGYCTTVVGDTQYASINADGSLGTFTTIASLTESRFGFGMLAWRDNIYVVGGCTSQDATSGACLGGIQAGIDYGHVNATGDISSATSTVASGAGSCTGGTPTNCNLPGTGSVGNHFASTMISNGFLYVIGGCTTATCTTTSTGVVFTGVSPTGSLVRPATCPTNSTATNGWCVMDALYRLPTSTAGGSIAIFGGNAYLVGGFSNATIRDTILRAAVNNDGTTSIWVSQSMTGIGALAVANTFAYARANPASTSNPGNLYIFGGCTTIGTSPTCTGFTGNVYKCNIGDASTLAAVASCSTTNQGQIGTVTGASGAGLSAAGGSAYGDYVYLSGGSAPGIAETSRVRYAKIDSSNNFGSWTESSTALTTARRNSTAYVQNGFLYVAGGYNTTSGILNTINYIKLNTTDGSLDTGGWSASASTLPAGRWGVVIQVSNGNAFAVGGCTTGATCTVATNTVDLFKVHNNDGGGPVSYANDSPLTTPTVGSSAAVLNGTIYVAGGCTTWNCSSLTGATSYAVINADGSVPSWNNGGAFPLSAQRAWGKLLAAGGTLYYVGGQTGSADTTAQSTVYYSSSFTGSSPNWGTATKGVGDTGGGAVTRTKFGATVWDNRLYIVGGTNATPANQTTVLVSPDQSSGGNITGNWTSTTAFNVARTGLSVAAYANNLYIIGGTDGTNYFSDVQQAKIDTSGGGSDGTVGSWSYSNSLPLFTSDADAFAANGYIYVVAGRNSASGCRTTTLTAPILSNNSSDDPTGVGDWQETTAEMNGSRYGAATTYYDGRTYTLNGGCGSLITGTNKTQVASLMTQPQVAKYSISFDTDNDVYPSNYLANGYNSASGAKWVMRYRSMSDPTVNNAGNGLGKDCSAALMSDWGRETLVSSLILGNNPPDTYTPLDSGGLNTSCARYYYFSLTSDNILAQTFPEDTSATRGPSITDLTLRYSAYPAKRLMHGRTFVGGLQMPDDTPYYPY